MMVHRQVSQLLCCFLALFTSSTYAIFSVNNMVSLSGDWHPDLRSCAWTITQAFDGWGSTNVFVAKGTHIRWGQAGKCVVDVTNPGNAVFVTPGKNMAKGFMEVLMSAGSSSPWGTRGKWGDAYFTVAHPNQFGGDVGIPYKRDVDEEELAIRNSTAADPATNPFAAHILALDLDALESDFELAAANETAVAESPSLRVKRSELRKLAKRLLVSRGVDCIDSRNLSGDWQRECACESTHGSGWYRAASMRITCRGAPSTKRNWYVTRMDIALTALKDAIPDLYTWPANLFTVTGGVGGKSGGVLHTPKRTSAPYDRPNAEAADCCSEMLMAHSRSVGYAPSVCQCTTVSPDHNWNIMVGDWTVGA